MRKLRQFTALFLVIAVVASLLTFSISVSAEENLPEITITDEDRMLIEKLQAFGVITNSYTASSYVTRREMAEIIKTYMKMSASSGSGNKPFDDVSDDDASFGTIGALRDLGIITGDENNNFRPDDYLSYNEAVVFVINAVGHKYFANREGGYPTGYMRMAIKFDMLDDLYMTNGDSFVPVIDVYKMLGKALDAATVTSQYYGDGSVRYTISETDTFLSDNYGIRKYRGTVTGNEFTNITSDDFKLKREQIQINDIIYDTPGYYYGYFLGYAVDYYVSHTSDGDELIYVEETPRKNNTVTVDSEDILVSKTTSSRIYYVPDENEDKEEHIAVDSVVDVIYNNQWYSDYGTLRNILPVSGYIEALDNDNDGVYEVLFVYDYTIAVVDSVDNYEEKIFDKLTNREIDLVTDVRRIDVISAKSMMPVPFATIQKDDVLNIAIGRGNEKVITIYVSDEVVNGKIIGYASDTGAQIGEENYKPTYNYNAEINGERIFPELTVGLTGTFYLDMNGKIAAYEYSSSGETALFAAIAGVDYNPASTMNRDVKVKLFTSDGKFVEAPFAKSAKIDSVRYDMTDAADCDRVLNILCEGYRQDGRYSVYDSYVLRYILSKEGEITFIDTGRVGGAGNLNEFADHWPISITRINIAFFAPSTSDIPSVAVFASLASDLVVFTTPVAGELSDETGYAVTNTWRSDHSFAHPDSRNTNFQGSNTTLMDNLSAYHMGQGDSVVLQTAIIRGGSISAGVSDDSALYIITETTSSVDADGMNTKTLYQDDEKIGQLAQSVSVAKSGVSTLYTVDQLFASNVIGDGSVVRCGFDNDGYIETISVESEYDAENHEIIPTFSASGSYIGSPHMYSVAKSNIGVAEIITYDDTTSYVDFKCGNYNYMGATNELKNLKIYDTSTGKIRTALPSEIRDGDKCVIRLRTYYRIQDMIIFR